MTGTPDFAALAGQAALRDQYAKQLNRLRAK
jgi:hypothetical protein